MPNFNFKEYSDYLETKDKQIDGVKNNVPSGYEFIWFMTSIGNNDFAESQMILDGGGSYLSRSKIYTAWGLRTLYERKTIIKY